ncbi:auxin-responsive protein IAA17-like [Zingiber officinale]|uniref:auxin-responsive protein IAA17-like n=1 Tax=Zingiber officinale TaxID=94328 RepID=UPI001C4BBB42|nr:auxin-responsive protein IAA17-like [Zingiber officinale]
MSPPLEHDYIGLSELHSPAAVAVAVGAAEDGALNLKETELRLGLPGSELPDRNDLVGSLSLGLLPKPLVSGAKRGFSDAIDGAGKWRLAAVGGRSEVDAGKGGALFSPKGENCDGQLPALGNAGKGKDAVAKATEHERKAAGQVGIANGNERGVAPAAKAQVVGWPPIRNYRKNSMATNPPKNKEDADGKQGSACLYVKVSMDGAPYLRKVDLKMYKNYKEFSLALEEMFSGFTIGQCDSHGIPGLCDGLADSKLTDLLSGSEYALTYEDKDGDWMLVGDVPWEMFTDSCRRLRIMKGSDAIGLAPRAMEKCKNHN